MVLCSKCKVMIKYQKFIFECVECGKKFRKKDIEDFFNGQNLNPSLTLKAAGIRNNSKILVITTKDIEGA